MTYGERSIESFLSAVASEEVTPAGGTVAAVVGATGVALCEMGCLHTVDAEERDPIRNGATGADLPSISDDLRWYRGRLLALADADADAVAALLAAHPDGTDAESKRATGVPLAVAEACSAVLDHATVVVDVGNPAAVPDVLTGAFLADAAVRASVYTVRHNADGAADPDFADTAIRRAAAVERDAERACDRVRAVAETRR